MEDERILELFFARNPEAIRETAEKYGAFCHGIAFRVLGSHPDADECVNDTWLQTWSAVPPQRPRCLQAFLGRIVRNVSLDRLARLHAQKRGGGRVEVLLSELEDCLPAELATPEQRLAEREVGAAVSRWLARQPQRNRVAFIRRYWYADSMAETARRIGCSEIAAKSLLRRMRDGMLRYLVGVGLLECRRWSSCGACAT